MNLKPLFDNVVVKPGKAEEQTKSGLYIPDTAQEKPKQGEIVAVGEGTWDKHGEKRMPMDVKVGDTVIYKEWGKTPFKIDGEEYYLLSQGDILALVEK